MESYFKGNWFKVGIIAIIIAIAIIYLANTSNKQEMNTNLGSDIAMQSKCATRATEFYKQSGYDKDSETIPSIYTNHWNKKLSKCFIQITSTSLKDGFIMIDVFDAFEGKQYATYNGYDPSTCNTTKLRCQLNGGNIWLDGNNTRNPADYHVGFQGVAVGPGVGDENTQKMFSDYIQPFMNE